MGGLEQDFGVTLRFDKFFGFTISFLGTTFVFGFDLFFLGGIQTQTQF